MTRIQPVTDFICRQLIESVDNLIFMTLRIGNPYRFWDIWPSYFTPPGTATAYQAADTIVWAWLYTDQAMAYPLPKIQ